jgi:hypothetical protein
MLGRLLSIEYEQNPPTTFGASEGRARTKKDGIPKPFLLYSGMLKTYKSFKIFRSFFSTSLQFLIKLN